MSTEEHLKRFSRQPIVRGTHVSLTSPLPVLLSSMLSWYIVISCVLIPSLLLVSSQGAGKICLIPCFDIIHFKTVSCKVANILFFHLHLLWFDIHTNFYQELDPVGSTVRYKVIKLIWWYWVSRGHLCLYILRKVKIWKGVMHAWLTDWLTDER